MRVALCISGQLRDNDGHLPALARLAKSMKAQVFVSTWSRRGTKVSGALNVHQLTHVFGAVFTAALPDRLINEQELLRAIPSFASYVEKESSQSFKPVDRSDFDPIFDNAIVDIEEDENLSLEFKTTSTDNNSLRMLYKIWRCNELKRKFERSTKQPFDIVIRVRPDVVPSEITANRLADIHENRGKIIFIDDVLPNIAGDKFALSDSVAADHYAGLFGKAIQSPSRPWLGIHHELHEHLKEADLNIALHRLDQYFRADLDRQRRNRSILLSLIADGDVAANVFRHDDEWTFVEKTLRLADQIEAEGPTPGDGMEPLPCEEGDLSARVEPDVAAAYLIASGHSFLRAQKWIEAYVANLLAWTLLGLNRPLMLTTGDVRVDMTLSAMVKAMPLHEHEAAFTWATARAYFDHPGLPDVLRQLTVKVLDGSWEASAQSALAHMKRRYEKSPIHVEALSHQWDDLIGQDAASAEVIARQMVLVAPEDWRGHDRLGHCREALGDAEGALACARAALDLASANGGLHCRVGCILLHALNRPAEAEPYLRRGAELWPDPRAVRWHIEALDRSDQQSEAHAIAAEAADRDPENFGSLYVELLERQFKHVFDTSEDGSDASEIAKKMIAIAPKDWRGYDHMGHCCARDGDLNGAYDYACAALALNPLHGGLQCRVGYVLLYLHDRPDAAEPYLRRGAELWPDPLAKQWHADALERRSRQMDM